jgi:cytochrome c-type biogenesis protein CcsB
MSANESLAQLSNGMVYASMVVYAGSFIGFAASFAGGRGQQEDDVATATESGRSSARAVDVTSAAIAQSGASSGGTATLTKTQDDDVEPLPPGRRAGNIAMSLMWLATAFLLAGVVARGLSAGRVPWGNMYEFSLSAALATAVVFLAISTRRNLRWLGVFVVGAILLTLGAAVTILYTESAQLVPALKSVWLVIHVLAAIICGGAFTVGAAVTALYLVRDRAEKKADGTAVTGWLSSRVPSAKRLDTMAYRINAFVFPLWTFAVIAGAIWAENAWGRYWGWDPKETWAFITWVIYAGYLHARATAGWRGRKAAVICLVGYVAFLINYFGVNFYASGLHSYAGVS